MAGNPHPVIRGRALKEEVLHLLRLPDVEQMVRELSRFPLRSIITPLFSFLCSSDETLKWRAVTLMGETVARLAAEDMESARIIIRRLMWNLNDESGGIGWGSAEALGEILSLHGGLAVEYAPILVSYSFENGNFQETPAMQRGVLWGIGRLAQVEPDLAAGVAPRLPYFLQSQDPAVRGLGAWVAGLVRAAETGPELQRLQEDDSEITIYINRRLIRQNVSDLCKDSIKMIESSSNPYSNDRFKDEVDPG